MNPKLVGCLVASMLLGACGAGLAIFFGWGVLVAFAIYSLSGAVSLVPFALLASHEQAPEPEARAAESAPVCA